MIAWAGKVSFNHHFDVLLFALGIVADYHLSVRVKCSSEDTVGDLKKLIAAQTGTDWKKIQLKKWYV
jgi:hypothetical protein